MLGSAAFVTRLRGRLPSAPTPRETREARAVERDRPELSWAEVLGEVRAHYGLSPADLARRGDHARPRAVAAWLGRRYTPVRLRELCGAPGYGRPASIAGILGRLEGGTARDPGLARDLAAIQGRLLARRDRG